MPTPVNRALRALGRSLSFGPVGLAAGALAGCASTTSSSSSAIVTGVEILAETVAGGHGCGKDPGQVYRYAVVVYHGGISDGSAGVPADGAAIASNLFECYADGLFSNLPASDSGSSLYVVRVYAYGYAAFQQNADVAALQCGPSVAPPCPAENPAVVTTPSVTGAADFTLDCTATQEQGVPVLARCSETPAMPGPDAADAATANEDGPVDGSPVDASQLDR